MAEEAITHIDALLAAKYEPRVRAHYKWLNEEVEKILKEKRDFDEDFWDTIEAFLGVIGTYSEDVASMAHRWVEKMQFSPWVEVQSDREGYRQFVCIDFRNPIMRRKWKAFLGDQLRVRGTKANDTSRNAMAVGTFHATSPDGEDTKKDRKPKTI